MSENNLAEQWASKLDDQKVAQMDPRTVALKVAMMVEQLAPLLAALTAVRRAANSVASMVDLLEKQKVVDWAAWRAGPMGVRWADHSENLTAEKMVSQLVGSLERKSAGVWVDLKARHWVALSVLQMVAPRAEWKDWNSVVR